MSPIVPAEAFGRDHWSTFLYAESCVVDGVGNVDPRKMRSKDGAGARYPTRTKTGEVADHDDYDCLRDLALAGLIDVEFGSHGDAHVALTEYGWKVAGALRRHRAMSDGHRIDTFSPAAVPANLDEGKLEVLMRSIAIYCDQRADIDRVMALLLAQNWGDFWKTWAAEGEDEATKAIRHPELVGGDTGDAGWLSYSAFAALTKELDSQGYVVETGLEHEGYTCPYCHSGLFLYEFRDTRGDGDTRPLLRHFLVCVECGAAKEVIR